MWFLFVNGVVGIMFIVILILMIGVMYYVFRQIVLYFKIYIRYMILIVIVMWLYGLLFNFFFVIGWSRVIFGKVGISCGFDWVILDIKGIIYIVFLLIFGFFIFIIMIVIFYYLIYRQVNYR